MTLPVLTAARLLATTSGRVARPPFDGLTLQALVGWLPARRAR